MDISEKKENDLVIVEVSGKIDSVTAPDFEERLRTIIEQKEANLLVDFSAVDYVSSAGLRAVLFAAKAMKSVSGKFGISGLKEHVKDVFDVSGLSGSIPLFVGLPEASFFIYEQAQLEKKASEENEKSSQSTPEKELSLGGENFL